MTATVALVGAGPGDPDLLTLRAEALLQGAAFVVADAAVAHLAARFAPSAAIVAVPDRVAAVDALLGAVARGQPIVRLYRGDTWLHPGHAAEASAVAEAGVVVEHVAGVAVEVAVPGAAGIPVHVRHLAVACILADAADAPPPHDPACTLVAVAADVAAAARSLAATGDPTLPAAAVVPLERTGAMQSRHARLHGPSSLGGLAAAAPSGTPGLVVVGAVAS